MNKWDMPTGEYWEKWFKEAYRTLKHGGYVLMFGMDRQLLMFKYYAALAGFEEHQSLYWYNISGFPKATDLSKMLDKSFEVEREIVGVAKGVGSNNTYAGNNGLGGKQEFKKEYNLTIATHDLAKKYEGYKYSIATLKQTNETILVFKKPNKTGSVLHDTIAMENGDGTVTVSALDVDGNRVGTESRKNNFNDFSNQSGNRFGNQEEIPKLGETEVVGRYPAQTFIDNKIAKVIDEQSGTNGEGEGNYGDGGGASKILHKVDFGPADFNITQDEFDENIIYEEDEEVTGLFGFSVEEKESKIDTQATLEKILAKREYPFDLYMYQPKVSSGERSIGLEGGDDMDFENSVPIPQRKERPFLPTKNNHPTLKPIELNYRILSLFKTPNNQRICYPFAGAGSEIIGGIKAGFTNWSACELNQAYVDIANKRINFFNKYFN